MIKLINRKFDSITIILLLCFLILHLNSCNPLFCTWNIGYEQISGLNTNDTIAGNYRLTHKSSELIKEKGYIEVCELKLLETGEYEIKNAPDLINDYYNKEGKIFNKKGKWFFICGGSSDCMMELEGIAVIPVARKKDGPISFLMTLGDGDECNGIIFERIR